MYRSPAIIILTLLLIACSPAAPAPTATPLPTTTPSATATPSPTATLLPTATPVPTISATPLAAADLAAAQAALLSGVQAAGVVGSYRATVMMRGNGPVGAVALGSPQAPAEIIGMEGAFSGANYSFRLNGFISALYGSNPAQGIQAARVAGQSYIHGPIGVIGALQDSWYRLPEARAMLATPPLYPAGLINLVAQSGVDPAGFTPVGQEQIDGLVCQRLSGDRAASLAILKSLSDSGLPVDTDPDHIDSVGANLWVCADGYLHQVELTFAGTTPGEKPLPFDFSLSLHMFDFGAAVGVSTPERAIDLMATPTR